MSEPNDNMILDIEFNHTGEISIPNKIVDQVIGQDEATNIMKKAAAQRRHVMLIGEPGTGKSLLGAALAEMLPQNELEDILVVANPENTNNPKIVTLPSGEGHKSRCSYRAIKKRRKCKIIIIYYYTFVDNCFRQYILS